VKLRAVRNPRVRRDELRIFLYIGENNLDAAERFLQAVENDIQMLREMPRIGARREFRHPKLKGLRSWPVSGFGNYLIFYRVRESELQIFRVIHGARDLRRALLE
jgi:toxin ParE1/3/4